jgi:hypothetical protein
LYAILAASLVRAIGAIDLYNVGNGDKPDYFNVLATVTKVFADSVLYTVKRRFLIFKWHYFSAGMRH